MPMTFICIDATIDEKKVGGDGGLFLKIDDTDEGTCYQVLLDFPKDSRRFYCRPSLCKDG